MLRAEIKKIIAGAIINLQKEGKFPEFQIPEISVEEPKERKYGDYSTNISLIIAKIIKDNPMKVAGLLESSIKNQAESIVNKVEVASPGFINFFISENYLQNQVGDILKQKEKFGSQNIGRKRVVIVDYSSPNIAKPMHVGHLRSTIIGCAIYNIYKFLGYKVIGDNHLGDWGTQFGIMIAACKKYRTEIPKLEDITIDKMLDIYIRFNKEMKDSPELQNLAKNEFKKLENGNRENRKIWKIIKEKSLKEFNKIYKILGIKFDLVLGESFYKKYLGEEIGNALKKGIAIKNSDNSIIINLKKFDLLPCLIQKSDGATLYETRDLATIRYRVKKYNPDKIIYIVGNEQTLHFEQLFCSAELLGYISHNKLHHVKFGLVLDENLKKLSTREGRFIRVEDLINKTIQLANKKIEEKNYLLSEKTTKKAAKIIGVGALKYNDLSQNRKTDIVFNWDKMMSFEGNSAPYLLYTYVRLKSILRKNKFPRIFEPEFLKEKIELNIITKLINFSDIIKDSADKFKINDLANYLYSLACLVNNFYEKLPVLKAEENVKLARLALIRAVTIVLKNGLNLLGIETLEKM